MDRIFPPASVPRRSGARQELSASQDVEPKNLVVVDWIVVVGVFCAFCFTGNQKFIELKRQLRSNSFMIRAVVFSLLILPFTLARADTVEVDIHGMTCGFCVEGLQKELSQLPDVARVDVSLKNKKVRISSAGDSLDMERVRSAIIDAGYTPVEIRHLGDEER